MERLSGRVCMAENDRQVILANADALASPLAHYLRTIVHAAQKHIESSGRRALPACLSTGLGAMPPIRLLLH